MGVRFLCSLAGPLLLAPALLRQLVPERVGAAEEPQVSQMPKPVFGLLVIGMGGPRTGTQSLHLALDALGYRTLHGGAHIHTNLTAARLFNTGSEGRRRLLRDHLERGDFDAVADFDDQSLKYLYERSPRSRVILTVHPKGPPGWVTSIDRLAKRKVAHPEIAPGDTGMVDVWAPTCIVPKHVPLSPAVRSSCERGYFDRNEHLRRALPAGRLLEFNVTQGWGPLCAFLGKQVPDIPFPKVDTVACFDEHGEKHCRQLFQSLVTT